MGTLTEIQYLALTWDELRTLDEALECFGIETGCCDDVTHTALAEKVRILMDTAAV